jgi:hypothetical protein
MIELFRKLEAWVNKKTNEHPAWNVLTWLGHGTGVAVCVGIAAIPLLLQAGDFRAYGAAFGIGFYTIREAVDQFVREKKAPASWSSFWRVFDPLMDVVTPWAVGIYLAML